MTTAMGNLDADRVVRLGHVTNYLYSRRGDAARIARDLTATSDTLTGSMTPIMVAVHDNDEPLVNLLLEYHDMIESKVKFGTKSERRQSVEIKDSSGRDVVQIAVVNHDNRPPGPEKDTAWRIVKKIVCAVSKFGIPKEDILQQHPRLEDLCSDRAEGVATMTGPAESQWLDVEEVSPGRGHVALRELSAFDAAPLELDPARRAPTTTPRDLLHDLERLRQSRGDGEIRASTRRLALRFTRLPRVDKAELAWLGAEILEMIALIPPAPV